MVAKKIAVILFIGIAPFKIKKLSHERERAERSSYRYV